MGTTKILEAYKENEEKFEIINKLSKDIQQVVTDKIRVVNDIRKVYEIIFKNFSTKKINTKIKIGIGYPERLILYWLFVNRDGFSIHHNRSAENDDYTSNIDGLLFSEFIDSLKEIKNNISQIGSFVKLNKQQLLVDFLKDIELLKFIKNFEKIFEKDIELEFMEIGWTYGYDDPKKKKLNITKIKVEPTTFTFDYKGEWIWNSLKIGINKIGLNDKLLIEQMYEELKQVLEEYLSEETKNLNNVKLFLESKKDLFAGQLVMHKLKQDNRSIK